MLSEDFAIVGTDRMPWEQFYEEEIVNRVFYKTLFYRYKGKMYQFQMAPYDEGEKIGDKIVGPESYIFFRVRGQKIDWRPCYEPDSEIQCFDSFKEAVDNAKMDDGKTLKEIWDDPESEYIDFL